MVMDPQPTSTLPTNPYAYDKQKDRRAYLGYQAQIQGQPGQQYADKRPDRARCDWRQTRAEAESQDMHRIGHYLVGKIFAGFTH
jgi:hypothetical protein